MYVCDVRYFSYIHPPVRCLVYSKPHANAHPIQSHLLFSNDSHPWYPSISTFHSHSYAYSYPCRYPTKTHTTDPPALPLMHMPPLRPPRLHLLQHLHLNTHLTPPPHPRLLRPPPPLPLLLLPLIQQHPEILLPLFLLFPPSPPSPRRTQYIRSRILKPSPQPLIPLQLLKHIRITRPERLPHTGNPKFKHQKRSEDGQTGKPPREQPSEVARQAVANVVCERGFERVGVA